MTPIDALVIGGGPAGSAATRLLAAWDHSVTVLTGPEAPNSLAESLPPSIQKLFRLLDIEDAVNCAGFYRTTGNTVWWGGDEARLEYFPAGPGYQVDRRVFDRLLRDHARAAGAVLSRASARSIDLEPADRAVVSFDEAGAGARSLSARFVLDCTGRAGFVARRGFRRKEPGHGTLALVAVWNRAEGWPLTDPTHTLVETYRDGWAWSVPLRPTERYVTFMVDREESDWMRGGGLAVAYQAELSKTVQMKRLLADSTLLGKPWSVDASLYSSNAYAGRNFLLVGDAGSFVDPMSSVGVKKALASAWLAAVTVHTCLTSDAMSSVALDYYTARERAAYGGHLRTSARYGGQARDAHPHPFWRARSEASAAVGADPDGEDLVQGLDLRTSYERLRSAPRSELQLSPDTTFRRVPAVKDRLIVLEDAIVIPGTRRAIRYVRGVDLVELVKAIGPGRQVPDLFEAYCRIGRGVPLPDFLMALAALVAANVVTEKTDLAVR